MTLSSADIAYKSVTMDTRFPYLQIVIQAYLCKLVLQVNAEIHVLHGVHHDVNELHTRHLQQESAKR